jgi:hypothetical protein
MADNAPGSEIRYLTPIAIETKKDKYCRFKKMGITYIDYKDERVPAALRERAGQDPAPAPYRHQPQVPAQGGSSHQALAATWP